MLKLSVIPLNCDPSKQWLLKAVAQSKLGARLSGAKKATLLVELGLDKKSGCCLQLWPNDAEPTIHSNAISPHRENFAPERNFKPL